MSKNDGNITYYTREEVKRHNSNDDLWIVLDNCVYDLTDFLYKHPGGEEVLLDRAGGDGTDCFDTIGHSAEAIDLRKTFKIGEIVKVERKDKDTLKFEEEYGRKFEIPKSVIYDYLLPALIVVVFTMYFFFY